MSTDEASGSEAPEQPMGDAEVEAAMQAAMDGGASESDAADGGDAPRPAPEFDEMPESGPAGDPVALSLLYDLTLPVAIELGRTRMSVQDLLALGRGSVIQLDRLAGEPVDVFVGDRRFAEGEVVVVGEQFGVRITRILAPPIKSVEAA